MGAIDTAQHWLIVVVYRILMNQAGTTALSLWTKGAHSYEGSCCYPWSYQGVQQNNLCPLLEYSAITDLYMMRRWKCLSCYFRYPSTILLVFPISKLGLAEYTITEIRWHSGTSHWDGQMKEHIEIRLNNFICDICFLLSSYCLLTANQLKSRRQC